MGASRRRVIHLVPWFGLGGRERLVADLAQGSRPARDAVVGTCGGAGIADLNARGIQCLTLPLHPSGFTNLPRASLALLRAVRRHDIGIIHGHHRFACLVGRLVAASCHLPFICTVHDLAAGQRAITKFSLGRTVTTFSVAVEQHVVEHFGVPRSRVHRLPMGCVVSAIGNPSATNPPTIGFFGRIEWEKGPDLFLRAGVKIRNDFGPVELVLAGTGEWEPDMRALANGLGIAASVRFLGWQPDVAAAMRHASVVVVPSRREGFGRSALEAMMLGKTVIAARTGGLPELIQDGITGRLVTPSDVDAIAAATLDVLRRPELAKEMGAAARARTESRFSIEAMVTAVEAIYQMVEAE